MAIFWHLPSPRTFKQRGLTIRSTGPIAACRHLPRHFILGQMPPHHNVPVSSNVRRRDPRQWSLVPRINPFQLEGAAMSDVESRNVAVVLKYFDGCNSGSIEDLLSTLDPSVIHYFLPQQFKTIRGAEHLANYWRKFQLLLNPEWKIDHTIAQGSEVVSEWSCLWTPEGTNTRLMMRGSEWYRMRDERILEVRAYYGFSNTSNIEFTDFPYAERGYLV